MLALVRRSINSSNQKLEGRRESAMRLKIIILRTMYLVDCVVWWAAIITSSSRAYGVPDSVYRTGILCHRHNCLEIHRGLILSNHW